jgi:hypothetical protein
MASSQQPSIVNVPPPAIRTASRDFTRQRLSELSPRQRTVRSSLGSSILVSTSDVPFDNLTGELLIFKSANVGSSKLKGAPFLLVSSRASTSSATLAALDPKPEATTALAPNRNLRRAIVGDIDMHPPWEAMHALTLFELSCANTANMQGQRPSSFQARGERRCKRRQAAHYQRAHAPV